MAGAEQAAAAVASGTASGAALVSLAGEGV